MANIQKCISYSLIQLNNIKKTIEKWVKDINRCMKGQQIYYKMFNITILEKCKLNDNLDSDTCHFFLNKTVKNKMKNYDYTINCR